MAVTNVFVDRTINHRNFQRTIKNEGQMVALLKILADNALLDVATGNFANATLHAAAAALNNYLFKAEIEILKGDLARISSTTASVNTAYTAPTFRTTGLVAPAAPATPPAPQRKPRLRWIKPKYYSSVIDAVKFDSDNKTLWIRMNSGNIYQYNDVTRSTFAGIRFAASPGTYYNANIKGRYTVASTILR